MSESIKQLEFQIEELKNKIAIKKVEQQELAKIKIEEILKSYGVDIEDLYKFNKIEEKKINQEKYRFGENSWTGRGRAPKWILRICEEQGITLEEFKRLDKYLV